jgi:hypothetical protein
MHAALRLMAPIGLVMGVALAGCDPDDGSSDPGSRGSGVMPTPQVMGVSPAQITAGEEVQIIGRGFCGPNDQCRTRVTFEGSFQGPYGPEAVQIEAQNVDYVDPGTMRWRFAPNIPFSTRGQIGTFSGTVKVFNEGSDGRGNTSAPHQVQMVVGPSIVVRQMSPLNGSCGTGALTDTTEQTSLMLEVEAVGLQPGTAGSPLLMTYTMSHRNFEFEGCFSCRFRTDPEQLQNPQGAVTLVDRVQSGARSVAGGSSLQNMRLVEQGVPATNSGHALTDWVASNVPLVDFDRRFAISGFKTRALPEEQGGHYTATIIVQAADAAGNMASRTIPVNVWSVVELTSAQSVKVQDFEPVAVSGCMHGSSPPAQLTYTDQRTETRERSLNSALIGKPQLGLGIGLLESIVSNNARIEAELGIKIQDAVSSAQLNGLNLQVQLLPGQVGVVYRQLSQMAQRVNVRVHSACGQAEDAGYMVLTDWTWGVDVARAKQGTCNPMPQTKLIARRFETPF